MTTDSLPYTFGAAATRVGVRHALNEDRYRILDTGHPAISAIRRGCLYAVADGVSSTPRGAWAADMACARLDSFFEPKADPKVRTLLQIIAELDWELREAGKGVAACTLCCLWIAHGRATVVHLGDSHVYRVRHGQAVQITHGRRGGRSLGAYLGMGPKVTEAVQVWEEPIFVGDLFLLVTDGVTEVVPPEELLDTWWAHGGSPQRAANAIIREVDRRKGEDDATALVVDVLAVESDPEDENTSTGRTDFRSANASPKAGGKK